MRLSAAYKGVNALLMNRGAEDFRSDRHSATIFLMRTWTSTTSSRRTGARRRASRSRSRLDHNKTPLTARTNRISDVAPSNYCVSKATVLSPRKSIADCGVTVDPALLRTDDFESAFENAVMSLWL